MSFVADLRHYVDEGGRLASMPAPALRIATFLCAIVSWASRAGGPLERTNVWCRRMRRRRPCGGEIVAGYRDGSADIVWECPECGDNGLIHDWHGSRWDRRGSA
jgi:hypothetical protein